MKIKIEREGCIQCGACASTCPDVFELPDDEKARVAEKYAGPDPAEGEVGSDLSACVQSATDSCPVNVITTE